MASRSGDAPRALRPPSYKVYFFLAIVLLMMALVVHNHLVIRRLNDEARNLSTVLARFVAISTFQAAEDPRLQPIFRDVVRNINFPVVLTDTKGLPRAWRRIGVSSDSIPDSLIARADSTGIVPPSLRRVQEIARRLDESNPPIAVVRLGHPGVLGHVHYGEPDLARQLRWVPYLEFGVVVLLLVFGFAGYRSLMAGEQRSLWAALAKETAHQLGTPLSSLLAWTTMLRGDGGPAPSTARVREIADEIDRDLGRLHKVTNRFAQVGSTPVLKAGDLAATVAGVVSYFRSRLPQLGSTVVIEEEYEPVPRVAFHPDLMEWVVENLLKNAIDAADKPASRIEVRLAWRRDERRVLLTVRDDGRGMTAEERRRAFNAGFSTKRRGWGLGLALARRVVREYHRGSISIVESAPGRGTTIAVTLPVLPQSAPRST
ncbi:MAG TPA: HAMP domain-containing sensor histidine kinase [Candidatus Eisenbacteria bacterium]